MRNETISISSDSSSEDDIPLKAIKSNGYTKDPNSYDSLCQHSFEACEFCDRISKNRYSSLIHNVKHIIIPLLNHTIYQCPTCLHSFTSEKDLSSHNMKKHPDLDAAQKLLVKDNYHNIWSTSQSSSHNNEMHTQTSQEQPNVTTIGTKINETEKTESIKNRLVFEDDDLIFLDCTSDKLLNDLTTDCKVKLEVFEAPWMNGNADEFSGKSVHYDELIKPGVYRCKKCGKGFPVRYDAIIHETSHMKLKNTQVSLCVICKKYLSGGKTELRHHYLTYHRPKIEENHLPATEYKPKLLFEDEEKIACHLKVLSLCELCFSFCKNKTSTSYECIKTVSEIGKRFECEQCKLLFFEIKLVRRFSQRKAYYAQRKRKKTNEDRLKTITNRFKMMKH